MEGINGQTLVVCPLCNEVIHRDVGHVSLETSIYKIASHLSKKHPAFGYGCPCGGGRHFGGNWDHAEWLGWHLMAVSDLEAHLKLWALQ